MYVGVVRGRRRGRRLVAGAEFQSSGVTVRVMLGAALVLFGLMWTFDNLGWTAAADVLRWWPLLLLAYGLMRLTGLGAPQRTTQGLFFSLAGALLVAVRLVHGSVGLGVLFPLLMIFAGVSIVRRAMLGEGLVSAQEAGGESVRLAAVLGAATGRGVGTALRRGQLSAVLGGVELDLREAQPASGRVELEVFTCLGGIEIIVPESWRVESSIAPIAGGFEDRTAYAGNGSPACTLVLTGSAILGGVVTRNTPGRARRVRVVRRRAGGAYVHEVTIDEQGVRVSREGEAGSVHVGPGGIHVGRSVHVGPEGVRVGGAPEGPDADTRPDATPVALAVMRTILAIVAIAAIVWLVLARPRHADRFAAPADSTSRPPASAPAAPGWH